MKGLSERQYAARVGLSRGAIQKAKLAGRLVLHDDGSIAPERSDARRAAMTDVSKSRAANRSPEVPTRGMRVGAGGGDLDRQRHADRAGTTACRPSSRR